MNNIFKVFNKFDFEKYENTYKEVLRTNLIDICKVIDEEYFDSILAVNNIRYIYIDKICGSYAISYNDRIEFYKDFQYKNTHQRLNTIIHEMIHSYITIMHPNKDRDNGYHRGVFLDYAHQLGIDVKIYDMCQKDKNGYYNLFNLDTYKVYAKCKNKKKLYNFTRDIYWSKLKISNNQENKKTSKFGFASSSYGDGFDYFNLYSEKLINNKEELNKLLDKYNVKLVEGVD